MTAIRDTTAVSDSRPHNPAASAETSNDASPIGSPACQTPPSAGDGGGGCDGSTPPPPPRIAAATAGGLTRRRPAQQQQQRRNPGFSIPLPERDFIDVRVVSRSNSCSRSSNTANSSGTATPLSRCRDAPTDDDAITKDNYHERCVESQFTASRLLRRLYLGSYDDATLEKDLRCRGITHVLNVAVDCEPPQYAKGEIITKHLKLKDDGDEDIYPHFPECFAFINNAMSAGGAVLVHCRLGVSRSATVVMAYLMTYGVREAVPPLHPADFKHQPIEQQVPLKRCTVCATHGRVRFYYDDVGEPVAAGDFHTHPEESVVGPGGLFAARKRTSTPPSMHSPPVTSCGGAAFAASASAFAADDAAVVSPAAASCFSWQLSDVASDAGLPQPTTQPTAAFYGSPSATAVAGTSTTSSSSAPRIGAGAAGAAKSTPSSSASVSSPSVRTFAGGRLLFTDYQDVFTYVAERREQVSPNFGFAMVLRKLNEEHGFRDSIEVLGGISASESTLSGMLLAETQGPVLEEGGDKGDDGEGDDIPAPAPACGPCTSAFGNSNGIQHHGAAGIYNSSDPVTAI